MGLLWNMLEKVKILTVVFLVKIPLESVAKKVHFSISFNLPHCFQRHIFSYHRLLYTKKKPHHVLVQHEKYEPNWSKYTNDTS